MVKLLSSLALFSIPDPALLIPPEWSRVTEKQVCATDCRKERISGVVVVVVVVVVFCCTDRIDQRRRSSALLFPVAHACRVIAPPPATNAKSIHDDSAPKHGVSTDDRNHESELQIHSCDDSPTQTNALRPLFRTIYLIRFYAMSTIAGMFV